MRYKLLKKIIWVPVGYEFEHNGKCDTRWEEACNELANLLWINNKEWFEEIKEVKSIYDLNVWDMYYSIEWNGFIDKNEIWDIQDLRDFQRDYYLYFATHKEAMTELQKRKAMATIKKWSHDNDKETISNWYYYMELNTILDCIIIRYNYNEYYKLHSIPYYSSQEIAEQSLKELEAEYKILFNIK